MSESKTLKDVLKPPFMRISNLLHGSNTISITDTNITVANTKGWNQLPEYIQTEFADWMVGALNEKWEQDFGEPKRWIEIDIGLYKCPSCTAVFDFEGFPHPYCAGCGRRLLPPEIKEEEEKGYSFIQEETNKYLEDPKTRVWINYNNEAGRWIYSVQVKGTSFWLDSFSTKKGALAYIKEHGLKKVEIK